MKKNKKDILKGFLLGVATTIIFLFIIGDVNIETDFQFGKETEEKNN